MPANSPTVEAFSLSHVGILDGTTGAQINDLFGVREASLEVDTDSFDNTGDNTVLSTWNWFNFATLSVKSGFIGFDTYALLSGNTLTTSGSGAAMSVSAPLWNESSLNTPTRPVLVRMPSKDSTGAIRTLDIILYKCQFGSISLDGPQYKDGLVVSYTAKAVMSSTDEKGAALPDRAIGRLISSPGTLASAS